MKRLILASGSHYRARQLAQFGLSFDTQPADIDETPRPGEEAQDLVRRLARAKAQTIARSQAAAIVIGSDQVAVLAGSPVSKPGNHAGARQQLRQASGQQVRFFTGLCVLAPDQAPMQHVDETQVHFRALHDAEIERYIKAEQPFDCAGSFKCEGLGISLFEAIETRDPSALVGLPLIALAGMLRQCGYSIP